MVSSVYGGGVYGRCLTGDAPGVRLAFLADSLHPLPPFFFFFLHFYKEKKYSFIYGEKRGALWTRRPVEWEGVCVRPGMMSPISMCGVV